MPPTSTATSPTWAGRAATLAIGTGLFVAAVVVVGLLVLAGLAAAGWVPGIAKPDYSHISAGDLGSLVVAGVTLLLADFTAVLAWFTRRAISETRREARIAEAALAAANKQAEIAERSLAAVQEQAKIAERQVEATNAQARTEGGPCLAPGSVGGCLERSEHVQRAAGGCWRRCIGVCVSLGDKFSESVHRATNRFEALGVTETSPVACP